MENREDSFHYTYSAAQRSEVESIRKKYIQTPPQENKMEQLRKLDHSATQKAQVWALTLGVLGTLILGTGMSLVMTELGALLGQWALGIGVAIGLVGIILVVLAYPVYSHILKKERSRIAPEILRLTDELMQ